MLAADNAFAHNDAGESIQITYLDGSSLITIPDPLDPEDVLNGIVDMTYQEIDVNTLQVIQSKLPRVSVYSKPLEDRIGRPLQEVAKTMRVTLLERGGKTYKANEIKPDGSGCALIMLGIP